MPVAKEGLGWDSLLKMVHNPGGDCYWVGGRPKEYIDEKIQVENGKFTVEIQVEMVNTSTQ